MVTTLITRAQQLIAPNDVEGFDENLHVSLIMTVEINKVISVQNFLFKSCLQCRYKDGSSPFHSDVQCSTWACCVFVAPHCINGKGSEPVVVVVTVPDQRPC